MQAVAPHTLSELELAILRKAAQRCGSDKITRQVGLVFLRDRKFTGVGVYVNLALENRHPEDAAPEVNRPIDGLLIKSEALCMHSADSIVWTDDDGYLECIEILGYGDGEYPGGDYDASC